MKRWIIVVPLVAVALAWAQADDDYYLGLEAYERGDHEEAFRLWKPLAERGDAASQYRLGRLYEMGKGVERDDAEAARWYRSAAEQGHPRAQNNLGLMYAFGRGVPEDDVEAVKWYRLAAEQGRAVAQINLAAMYERGEGVAQDLGQAVRWYRAAANRGHAGAQFTLASLHEAGRGVAQDDAKAASWYRRAAKRDHAEAQYKLAALYEQGRGVPQDRQKAVKWYRKSAALGSDDARRRLDELARGLPVAGPPAPEPEPVAREPVEAKAAPATNPATAPDPGALEEQGDADALYRRGRAAADPAEAERLFLAAARQGHEMATYHLGFVYLRGQGGSGRRDLAAAYAWFSIAADAGIGDAAAWRDKAARKLTRAELSAAEELIRTARPSD